ncbi:MAG: RING finger protein [Planctomycetota bacterium]
MIRAPRCPYCHDGVSRGEQIVVCRECHAFHHDACFREGAGCAACRRALAVATSSRWQPRRLAAALSVFFGFLFGEVLGASVTVIPRISERADAPTKAEVSRRCEQCCPRHHHDCH